MKLSSALFSLSALALTTASPLESFAHKRDGYEGLRLPMKKKDVGIPLHKRASGVAVNNR